MNKMIQQNRIQNYDKIIEKPKLLFKAFFFSYQLFFIFVRVQLIKMKLCMSLTRSQLKQMYRKNRFYY